MNKSSKKSKTIRKLDYLSYMIKFKFLSIIIFLTSLNLQANELRSIKVIIKFINGGEIIGNIIANLPDGLNYTELDLVDFLKSQGMDSLMIANQTLVYAQGNLLRFIEKSSMRSFAPNEIESIRLISADSRPVPKAATIVNSEEFKVLSKELKGLHYVAPEDVSNNMRFGFLFLSFGSNVDLNYYVDEFINEIDKAHKSNNLDNVVHKALTIRSEAIKKNIYLHLIF